MKFRTVIQLNGKTATGIEVPPEVVEALGSGKRPAVSVKINGYTYRSTVAPMGGVFMLPVSADVRERANVAAGDEVNVELEPDTAPRTVTVPPDLARTLEAEADAKAFFEGLSYSKQQRVVLPLEQAKTAETRAKRLEKAMGDLRAGRA
jgi:Domain of unknown function (DUF1905)/Bacteriocin-protection, YdeI or OmpD-Associated